MKNKKRYLSVVLCVVLVLTLIVGCSNKKEGSGSKEESGEWTPSKPITMIVPYSAGGGVDVTARVYAKYFEKYAGVKMVVNNITGGGGVVGYTEFASSNPDGYTMTLVTTPTIQNQFVYDGVVYNEDTFEPIGMLTNDPSVMCVQVGGKYDVEPEELLEMIKENPGEISVGCGTSKGVQHLGMMTFQDASGLSIKVVPFDDGGAQTIAGLAGGHIDISTGFYTECQSFVNDGTLRVIWTAGEERPQTYCQDIPTLKELGVDAVFGSFRGVAVVDGTPDEVVEGLLAIHNKVVTDEEFLKELDESGADPNIQDAAALQKAMEQVVEDAQKAAALLD